MNTEKISMIALVLVLLVAIASAFATVPQLGLALLVLGAISGWDAPMDRRVGVGVAALVLTGLSGELSAIPAAGNALATIFGNIGIGALGASIIGICQTMGARIKF